MVGAVDIPLNKLIPHESSAVITRMNAVREIGNLASPIFVKPILDEYFYICQGHNRAYVALDAGEETISGVVGTPDVLRRREEISRIRLAYDSVMPLRSMSVDPDDLTRQNRFFRDTSHLCAHPFFRSNRGTIIRLSLVVAFANIEFRVKSLPMKGRLGGIIFNPALAERYLRLNPQQVGMLKSAWGSTNNYLCSALPSFIELSVDGLECRAAGHPFDDAFFEMPEGFRFERSILMNGSERASIKDVYATVVYPDGNVWEGSLGISSDNAIAMLWDDRLIRACAPNNDLDKYFASLPWWQCATSIIMRHDEDGDASTLSCMSAHSCGSTCVGGGCLI